MKIQNLQSCFFLFTALSILGGASVANVIPPTTVPSGQMLTINAQDTVFVGSITGNDANFFVYGSVDNYGQINAMNGSNIHVRNVLKNYGNVFASGAFSIVNGSGSHKIFNQPTGNVVVSGYVDMYPYDSYFENAGRFSLIRSLGHEVYDYGFSWLWRGTFKNVGIVTMDRNNGGNVCGSSSKATFINEGLFEVASGTICDFGAYEYDPVVNPTVFRQTKGETVVNGKLGSHQLDLQGGKLSGTGTVLRFPEQMWSTSLSISPGSPTAPIGVLTLVPEVGYIIFGDGALEIGLGNAVGDSDRLQVNGEIYLVAGARVNVSLHDGFVPTLGNSFTIVSADNVGTDNFELANLNLPKLPGALRWRLDNLGTALKLTVY